MKRNLLILSALILLTVVFACSDDDNNTEIKRDSKELVGIWANCSNPEVVTDLLSGEVTQQNIYWVINADGTMVMYSYIYQKGAFLHRGVVNGMWKTSGNKITFTRTKDNSTYNGTFAFESDKLVLNLMGKTRKFVRITESHESLEQEYAKDLSK